MKLTTRYVLAGIMITIGCASWYFPSSYHILGLFFIVVSQVFTDRSEIKEITHLRLPRWNSSRFFPILTLLLGAALVVILMSQLSEAEVDRLFGSWYFTGVIWLLLLSMLMTRFLEEKEKSLLNEEQRSPEGVLSD